MEKRVMAAMAILIGAIFFLDRMLPPDVSASVLYVLPIMLALSLRSSRLLGAITAACVAATLAALFVELAMSGSSTVWENYILALIAELTTAWLVWRQVSIAVENARLFADTSRQRERLAMINRIGQVFASTLDLEKIYFTIREMLSTIIDCESLLISFYNSEDETIRCAFAYTDGKVLPVERFEPLELGTGPQSECIRTARPLIVDNIARRHPGGYRYVGDSDQYPVAILYVPMIAEERVIGVIQAQSVREGAYTEEDVPLLSIIANQAASAILNARLYIDAVEGRRAMERANRIKDEFLATLSHELRTPLTPILGWTQILSRIEPDDRETLLHAVSVIERNARFQTRLVNELLDMSRIESGKLLVSLQPCDLNAA
ncbi:MAG TPA: GAF domain-containing protein, partial [Blastocatellia bacterium]|nr:GAF domain-containing protein [Blastocatellia bacterium]